MNYVEPIIISYSENELKEIIEAFASPCSGGIVCQSGTPYSQRCGIPANYCSQAANYTGLGETPQPCGVTSAYVGANDLNPITF